jgi:hypothetical protein
MFAWKKNVITYVRRILAWEAKLCVQTPWMVYSNTCRRVVECAGSRYETRLSGRTGSKPPQETSVSSLVLDPKLSDAHDL